MTTQNKTKAKWKLENKAMEIGINKTNGLMESFFLKKKNIELSCGKTCNLSIEDRTAKVAYNILASRVKAVEIEHGNEGNPFLALELHYENAPFRIGVSYALEDDCLKWNIKIRNFVPGEREIHVAFSFPWFKPDLRVFMPHEKGHFSFEEIAERYYYNYFQRNEPEPVSSTGLEIGTPSFTVYDHPADYGITATAPFDQTIPRLTVDFDKKAGEVCMTNRYLRLADKREISSGVVVVPHEGDWRPGLDWMRRKYPEYFRVGNPQVWEYEGAMLLANVTPESCIRELKEKEALQWTELHCYFPHYGLYVPETSAWDDLRAMEGLPGAMTLTRGAINEYLSALRRQHVAGVIYFQTFECWQKFAEEKFPESIIRDLNGKPICVWMLTCLMNPDPDLPWGKHLLDQAKKMLETYPGIAGFFVDVYGHREFDFAHDDGVSMVCGKRCYMIRHAHRKIMGRIAALLHDAGKFLWVNGPGFIDAAEGIDGLMAECTPASLEWAKYFALERPMVYLPTDAYTPKTPRLMEQALQECLKSGAFPHVSGDHVSIIRGESPYASPTKAMCALLGKYQPLFEHFKRKRWILTPHALTLPAGINGNIFENSTGEYVVTLVCENKSSLSVDRFLENIPVAVNVPDAEAVCRAEIISSDYSESMPVTIKKKTGTGLELAIPKHHASSLIILRKK